MSNILNNNKLFSCPKSNGTNLWRGVRAYHPKGGTVYASLRYGTGTQTDGVLYFMYQFKSKLKKTTKWNTL